MIYVFRSKDGRLSASAHEPASGYLIQVPTAAEAVQEIQRRERQIARLERAFLVAVLVAVSLLVALTVGGEG